MASRAFVDLKTALLVIPLVSSTCSLLFAWDQNFFLRIFLRPSLREHGSNSLLPSYFQEFVAAGVPAVLAYLTVTTASAIGCISLSRPLLQARGSLLWYAAGAGLALSHLLYVPAVMYKIQAIVENQGADGSEDGKTNLDILGTWLDVNFVRMLTADLGAWACCFLAVTKTFAP